MARRSHSFRKHRALLSHPRRLAFESLEDRRLLAIVVDTNSDVSAPHDGRTTLREAIAAANATSGADTIEFASSLTAKGAAKILLTQGEIAVTQPLTINGPGAELLTIDAAGSDPTPDSSLRDDNNANDGDGSRILVVDDTRADRAIAVLIAGVTLTGGDSRGIGGGAILNKEDLTIVGAVVTGNSSSPNLPPLNFGGRGGGIYNSYGKLTIRHTTISGNESNTDGGGIHSNDGSVQIAHSAISGNHAGNGQRGGGLYGIRTAISATNSVIADNYAAGSIVSGGGGFYSRYGSLRIASSLISGNVGGAGGGIAASECDLHVISTLIDDNVAGNGSGIYAWRSVIDLASSTVSNNQYGPGIYVWAQSSTTIRHSTIFGNRAINAPGGIYALDPVTLDHSIVAGNRRYEEFSSTFTYDDFRGTISARYSLLNTSRDGTIIDAGGNKFGVNPMLGPLSYFGGPVFADGSRMLHFALLTGSPAINAGDPALVAGSNGVPEFDQRGESWSRVVGGRIDIGAIEAQANPLPGDYNFNGVVDAADYSVWRDTLGSTTDLRADGSGATVGVPDGVVDERDYAFWKLNFGKVISGGDGGGSASFAAPEPQGVVVEEMAAPAISKSSALAGELRLAGPTVTFATSPARRSSPAMRSRLAAARDVEGGLLAWLLQARTRSASPAPSAASAPASAGDLSDVREVDALDSAFASIGSTADRRGL